MRSPSRPDLRRPTLGVSQAKSIAAAPTDTTAFLLAAFNDDSCLATTQFADTLGTDILKEGFVFEPIAGQPLRTSISPRTAVGALVVALLKMVTTIRFHGALS